MSKHRKPLLSTKGDSPERREFKESHRSKTADFTSDNIKEMGRLRSRMNEQILLWALFSFNNIENGAHGGVYELLERERIIFISALSPGCHVRDALNCHFSGDDDTALSRYLTSRSGEEWRNFYVRYMISDEPWDDAKMLLKQFQLDNCMKKPRFNDDD